MARARSVPVPAPPGARRGIQRAAEARGAPTFISGFVAWAESYNAAHGVDNRDFEEIHGYHLEAAHRYLTELGTIDHAVLALGQRASDKRLGGAARHEPGRHAGIGLPAGRAAACLPADSLDRLRILPDLAEALMELPEFDEAERVLREAKTGAEAQGDGDPAATAELVELLVRQYSTEEGGWSDTALRAVDRAIPVFEATTTTRASPWRRGYGWASTGRGRSSRRLPVPLSRSFAMRRGRRPATRTTWGRWLRAGGPFGPTPVDEAVVRCEELAAEAAGDRRTEALVRNSLAQLYSMQGNFDLARSTWATADTMLNELEMGLFSARPCRSPGQIELLAGDLADAEEVLEAAMRHSRA